MTFTFERIRERQELEHDRDWWRVFEESFLPAHRARSENVARGVENPKAIYLRARFLGRTVALAQMQLLENPGIVFLAYIAVSSEMRGRGLGGDLLTVAAKVGSAALRDLGQPSLGMILESEHGDGPGDESPTAKLYRNHGFRELPLHYEQPPINGCDSVPMHLLFRPEFKGLRLTPKAMIALVSSIYEQEYGPNDFVPENVLSDLLARTAASIGLDANTRVKLGKTS